MFSFFKVHFIYASPRDFTFIHIIAKYSGACYNIDDLFHVLINCLQFSENRDA